MSYVRESSVEGYLKKEVKRIGGRSYKWVSPGEPGVMDQIVMLPWMRDQFVETKAPKGKEEFRQKIQRKRLMALGRAVWLLYTHEAVDYFIKTMLEELK